MQEMGVKTPALNFKSQNMVRNWFPQCLLVKEIHPANHRKDGGKKLSFLESHHTLSHYSLRITFYEELLRPGKWDSDKLWPAQSHTGSHRQIWIQTLMSLTVRCSYAVISCSISMRSQRWSRRVWSQSLKARSPRLLQWRWEAAITALVAPHAFCADGLKRKPKEGAGSRSAPSQVLLLSNCPESRLLQLWAGQGQDRNTVWAWGQSSGQPGRERYCSGSSPHPLLW
jgi:hypothetical protein